MKNTNVIIQGLELNKDKETIKISNLEAEGSRNLNKIMAIIGQTVNDKKYACDHVSEGGSLSIKDLKTGGFLCTKCNKTMKDLGTKEETHKVISDAIGVLETLKMVVAFTGSDRANNELINSILESLEDVPGIIDLALTKFEDMEQASMTLSSYNLWQTAFHNNGMNNQFSGVSIRI